MNQCGRTFRHLPHDTTAGHCPGLVGDEVPLTGAAALFDHVRRTPPLSWIRARRALTGHLPATIPEHAAGHSRPTRATVDLMIAQAERDRATAYWSDPPRDADLDAVEAWLRSLRDWLPADSEPWWVPEQEARRG